MLLINDHQTKASKLRFFGQQLMGTNHNIRFTRSNRSQCRINFFRGFKPRELHNPNGPGGKAIFPRGSMLLSQ